MQVLPGRRGPTPSGSRGGISTGEAIGIGAGVAVGTALVAEWWKHHHEHASNQEAGQTLQRNGLTLRCPPDWQPNPAVPEGGPISLNTFNSQYLRGGIIPSGGADIDISYLPSPNLSLQQIMAMDLEDAEDQFMDPNRYRVAGDNGTRISYTDTYTPGLAYRSVVVYVPRGAGLYKFFLTYHKGDSHEAQFIADFENILKSVRFAQ